MPILRILALVGLLSAGAATAGTSQYETSDYRNPTFGFSLKLPVGSRICMSPAITTDHGVAIPLTAEQSCDQRPINAPAIYISAGLDAAYAAPTAEEVASNICQSLVENVPGRLDRAPGELSFPRRTTFLCRVEGPQNKIVIELITLLRSPRHPMAPGTAFEVSLVTDQARLVMDMQTLKKVFAAIRFDANVR